MESCIFLHSAAESLVGAGVGAGVGGAVGAAEGRAVGAAVGLAVGDGVGLLGPGMERCRIAIGNGGWTTHTGVPMKRNQSCICRVGNRKLKHRHVRNSSRYAARVYNSVCNRWEVAGV